MTKSLSEKSSIDEIRARFDSDVERFSNLETGQAATIDAPLSMELITQAAVSATPDIERILDIGCGAGNNTLRLAQIYNGKFRCDLSDISRPMLERAKQRLLQAGSDEIHLFEGDFRAIPFDEGLYDVVIAAAVLHHLRDDADWEFAFQKIYKLLRPGGSFWVTDLVTHESEAIDKMMWERYGVYLESKGGLAYRKEVFDYIEKEDSPRPLTYQLDLMRKVGFKKVEVLHKNSCFAAFGAMK